MTMYFFLLAKCTTFHPNFMSHVTMKKSSRGIKYIQPFSKMMPFHKRVKFLTLNETSEPSVGPKKGDPDFC